MVREFFVHLKSQIHWYDIVFVILCVLCLTAKILAFNYPLEIDNGEGSRDYMVSHLIASYGEFPKYGPANGIFQQVGNSALYYYLISVPLFVYDSVWTNIALQIFSQIALVFLIYLLARRMFGGVVGCVAVLLFAFTPEFIFSSRLVWQPFFMLPFLYASFIFLLTSYQKKSQAFLVAASAVMIVAITIHNAAGAFLPMFIFTAWFIAKKIDVSVGRRLLIMAGSAFLFCLFYIVNLTRLIRAGDLGLGLFHTKDGVTVSQSFHHLSSSAMSIVKLVGSNFSYAIDYIDWIHAGVLLCLCAVITMFFFEKKTKDELRYTFVLLGFIFSFCVLLMVFGAYTESHYIAPILGLMVIFIANAYVRFFNQSFLLKGIGLILLVPILFAITSRFQFLNAFTDTNQHDKNHVILSEAVDAITESIHQVQMRDGYPEPNFFRIEGLRNEGGHVGSAVVLTPLEKRLNKKLTWIDERFFLSYNYKELNSDDYLYLFCVSNDITNYSGGECTQFFVEYIKGVYAVEEQIFDSKKMKVFLLKKI